MIRNPKEDHAEEKFIESFKRHKNSPLRTLLSIYRGNYSKFFLSVLFFVIKHSPVWMAPIVLANIINYVTLKVDNCMEKVILNVGLMIFFDIVECSNELFSCEV